MKKKEDIFAGKWKQKPEKAVKVCVPKPFTRRFHCDELRVENVYGWRRAKQWSIYTLCWQKYFAIHKRCNLFHHNY